MNDIAQNIYAFYEYVAKTKGINLIAEKGYQVAYSDNNFWLELIFNIDQTIKPETIIENISSDIDNKNYPPYFMAEDSFLNSKHSVILKNQGIVPLKILRGMHLKLNKLQKSEIPSGILLKELSTETELKFFSDIINQDLIPKSSPIDAYFLKKLIDQKQVSIFGLLLNENIVSVALTFVKTNCAGLYFIATPREFRKKGFATILIGQIKNIMFDRKIVSLVLHANNRAFELYKKIGFVHKNNFIIYKKL